MAEDKHVSSKRLGEWFDAMPAHAARFRERMLHWVVNASHVTGRVASGTSIYEEQAIFVVRLAGILSDLRGRFAGSVMSAAELAAAGFADRHREECRTKLAAAIEAERDRLTDDELLWLELRRHEQSHPFLDGYRPDPTDKATWNSWKSKMLDKRTFTIDEVIERCELAETANGGGFTNTAVAIARKVFQEVGAVRSRMTPVMAGVR